MTARDRYLLERALDGALSPDEVREFEARQAGMPGLRDQFERERRLHHLASEAAVDTFAPYFEDRVMRRLRARHVPAAAEANFAEALVELFRRFAPAAMALALVLVLYNVSGSGLLESYDAGFLEAVFALPPVTPEATLTF